MADPVRSNGSGKRALEAARGFGQSCGVALESSDADRLAWERPVRRADDHLIVVGGVQPFQQFA
jgi:hypothetical protein